MAIAGTDERLDGAGLRARSCPSASAAARPSASSAVSKRPFQATSAPPGASSGAAYSTTTGSAARARATTRSCAPRPSSHASARALTTSTLASPSSARRPGEERALAPHALDQGHARLGQRDRQRQAREPAAGAEIGDPAGGAHRGQRRAPRASRPTCTSTPSTGSRTVVMRRRLGRDEREQRRELRSAPAGARSASQPPRRAAASAGTVKRETSPRARRRPAFHVKPRLGYVTQRARRRGGGRAPRPRCTSRRRRDRAGTRAPACARSPSSRPARPGGPGAARPRRPGRPGAAAPRRAARGSPRRRSTTRRSPAGEPPPRVSTIRKTRCCTASIVCPWRPMNRPRSWPWTVPVTTSPSRSTSTSPFSPSAVTTSSSTSWTVLSTTSVAHQRAFRSSSCAAGAGAAAARSRGARAGRRRAVVAVGARFRLRLRLLRRLRARASPLSATTAAAPAGLTSGPLPGAPSTGNPAPRRMTYCWPTVQKFVVIQ